MSPLAQLYSANAGWRQTRVARTTGLPVSIYDAEPAGMDPDGGRWQTVCEAHGSIISHQTLSLARYHASAPDEWCACCMGDHTEACDPAVCHQEETR